MDFSFSIDKIIKVIKRYFVLMVVAAIAFYSLGYYLTIRSTSVLYYSYTELYIHTIASDPDEYAKYIDTEGKYVDTYLLTINTYKFYEELREQLPEQWKKEVSSGYLKGCVSTAKRDESAIVRFSVTTDKAEKTLAITQTLSTYMDDYLYNNYRVKDIQLVEEPRPPVATVNQSSFLTWGCALVGILLTFVFGYIKVIQDRRISSSADIEEYEIPVLGVIPSFDSKPIKKGRKYAYGGYDTYSTASDRAEKNQNSKKQSNEKGKKK